MILDFLIYNTSIYLYHLAVSVASLFNPKAKQWINGRKNIFKDIRNAIGNEVGFIWIHCASLGEFEQVRPIIEGIKKQNSESKILITFFSPSGYEVRKNYELASYVFYLPIDTPHNAIKFVELTKPQIAIFIKYEIWANYLFTLKKNNIPSYLVAANFRKNQAIFKWYGKHVLKALSCFDHIFAQNQLSQKLLSQHNIKNVSIANDTKFDRVYDNYKRAEPISIAEAFKDHNKIIIIGSAWKKEASFLIQLINSKPEYLSDYKFIIAPHIINENFVQSIISQLPFNTIRYSEASTDNVKDKKALIIDNIGMLSKLYQYANIAIIGGGFNDGIHNILEAVVFDIPVLFGPKHKKFNEAVELLYSNGAYSFSNYQEFKQIISKLTLDKTPLYNNHDYIVRNKGGSELILEKIEL